MPLRCSALNTARWLYRPVPLNNFYPAQATLSCQEFLCFCIITNVCPPPTSSLVRLELPVCGRAICVHLQGATNHPGSIPRSYPNVPVYIGSKTIVEYCYVPHRGRSFSTLSACHSNLRLMVRQPLLNVTHLEVSQASLSLAQQPDINNPQTSRLPPSKCIDLPNSDVARAGSGSA